jgi:hypothetical protein
MVLTPWTVQAICYEVLKNYMTTNTPQSQGYAFAQKYDPDPVLSDIGLDMSFNFKDDIVQKRPGIFVSRGDVEFDTPTIKQAIGHNAPESTWEQYALLRMPVNLAVIGTNVGFTEQLAQYVFNVFLRYRKIIQEDFCLRAVKLVRLSAPSIYPESKDHFVVNVSLNTAFDMGTVIKGDDLKLKTVAYTIFTNCLDRPLTQQ